MWASPESTVSRSDSEFSGGVSSRNDYSGCVCSLSIPLVTAAPCFLGTGLANIVWPWSIAYTPGWRQDWPHLEARTLTMCMLLARFTHRNFSYMSPSGPCAKPVWLWKKTCLLPRLSTHAGCCIMCS